MKILVTGGAGFIGSTLCAKLLEMGHEVWSVDNLSGIDSTIKMQRLLTFAWQPNARLLGMDITDRDSMDFLFKSNKFDVVYHLAAKAGVKASSNDPSVYIHTNIVGFNTILQCCVDHNVPHFIYASSSSVYEDTAMILHEDAETEKPRNIYAATKKTNEILAKTYSDLYGIQTTGVRMFTVYGPWNRPDMAAFKFMDAIHNDRPVNLFDDGMMTRDFTYIDDAVYALSQLADFDPTTRYPLAGIFNICSERPILVDHFLKLIEINMGKTAIVQNLPAGKEEAMHTYGSMGRFCRVFGTFDRTPIEVGVGKLVQWYKKYY